MQADFIVIGAGLTGGVLARVLHDAGQKVVVVDRRTHVGGNVHDHFHESGIRIHTYGPHYFRTSSEKIWDFVTRFSSFYQYEAVLRSLVDGRFEYWPVTNEYIERAIGTGWNPSFSGVANNFEEASLAMMPRPVYEKFVKGYTEKQWGVAARALQARLAGRFEVHDVRDPRLKRHKYQGIPTEGYANFTATLLAGIPVLLNCDYLAFRSQFKAKKLLVFTGPIDEYFGFDLGKLAYRGQRRSHSYLPHVNYALPCGQVNNPAPCDGAHVRTLEWKHMLKAEVAANIRGTVLTTETPFTPENPNEYEYPFPDSANQALFQKYRERAEAIPHLLVCGRLGEYRYYDMDQAIGRALMLAERILTLADLTHAIRDLQKAEESMKQVETKSLPLTANNRATTN